MVCVCVQFRSLPSHYLGLLVGIKVPRRDDGNDVITHVLLGCVSSPAVPSSKTGIPPPPQWAESWERVRPCLPGGCEVCGVCVSGEDGKEKQRIVELLGKTDLTVSV